MREVKALFDPANVMNPGKIVDSPAMTEHLRDPALPPAQPLRTAPDLRRGRRHARRGRPLHEHRAVPQDARPASMCPSYVATQQEEHSTRGRANALVKALSEPDPAAALGSDERLHEILDLCLMCKACKSECPLGVDMATLKSETLAHHHEAHGTPLRSRAFGAIRALNRLGLGDRAAVQPARPVAPAARGAWDARLGVAPERPLPVFKRDTLVRWFGRRAAPTRLARGARSRSSRTRSRPSPSRGSGGPRSSCWSWPAGRCGSSRGGCCGRASLSKGLVDDAKAKASRLAGLLTSGERSRAADRRLRAVVRLDASRRARGAAARRPAGARRGRPGAPGGGAADRGDRRRRAGAAVGLVARRAAGALPRALPPEGRGRDGGDGGAAVADPRCRGGRARRRVLRDGGVVRLRGRALRGVDGGGCGPALPRGAAPSRRDTVVAATGVSCRQQIAHGTMRRAQHPVELLRSVVAG